MENQNKSLLNEVTTRFSRMFRWKFFFYSAIFLLIGGIGVWLPALIKWDSVLLYHSENLLTYSVAIIGTLLCDYLILDNSDYVDGTISLGIYLLSLISGLILLVGYLHHGSNHESSTSLIGTIIVILMWLFTYSKDAKFDRSKPTAPLGGDVSVANLRG